MPRIKNTSSLQIQYLLNLFYLCTYIPPLKSDILRRGWKRLDLEKSPFKLKKHLFDYQLKNKFLRLKNNFVDSQTFFFIYRNRFVCIEKNIFESTNLVFNCKLLTIK